MENPLASMPSDDENKSAQQKSSKPKPEPQNQRPQNREQESLVEPPQKKEQEAPEMPGPENAAKKAQQEKLSEKKSFFTKGKIIAIFVGLVVIAAIVGAVIYYQSSEQFQGATFDKTKRETTAETAVVEGEVVESCPSEKGLAPSDRQFTYKCACTLDERTPNPEIWDPVDGVWTEDPTVHENPCVCPEERPIFDSEANECIQLELAPLAPIPLTRDQETCENTTAKGDLINAYNQRNWDAYRTAIQKLDDLDCFSECDTHIYWIILYLNTNDIDNASTRFASFKRTCGSDCNTYFNLMAIVAEILSDKDQRIQTFEQTRDGLSEEELNFLSLVAQGYINSCQCISMEDLLANPPRILDSYFEDSSDLISAVNEPLSSSRLTKEDLNLVIAYAQAYSPSVQSVLQQVYDDNCIVEEIPQNCEDLNIKAPFESDTHVMDNLFDPATDELAVEIVGGEDNIQNYRYTAAQDTVKFDDTSSDFISQNQMVSLSGGPAEGDTEEITVTAIDVTGRPLTECSDSFTITRPAEEQPVCRSLEIVEPAAANQPGTPTIEIPASGFENETIRVELDADPGSYVDLRYTSDNGNITFNDEGVLDTSALSVSMDGAPPEDVEELVTVWARQETDGGVSGIETCNDAFIVTVSPEIDEDEPPRLTFVPPDEEEPVCGDGEINQDFEECDDGNNINGDGCSADCIIEDEPPSLTYVPPDEEEDEPPVITYVPPTEEEDEPSVITYVPSTEEEDEPPTTTIATTPPTEPTPVYVTQTPAQPAHAAAPATPETGPGLIIPLIGTALGGAWLRRKKK